MAPPDGAAIAIDQLPPSASAELVSDTVDGLAQMSGVPFNGLVLAPAGQSTFVPADAPAAATVTRSTWLPAPWGAGLRHCATKISESAGALIASRGVSSGIACEVSDVPLNPVRASASPGGWFRTRCT